MPVQVAQIERGQQNVQAAQAFSSSGTSASAEHGISVAQGCSFTAPSGPVPAAPGSHLPWPPPLPPAGLNGTSGVAEAPVPGVPGSNNARPSGAAEHAASRPPDAATSTALPIIFTATTCATLRKKYTDLGHKLARAALNKFINDDYEGPVCLEALFDWRNYLALHPMGIQLVGPGITRAIIDQFEHIKDPNRGNKPRADFIFHRADGTAYRVHPGSKPRMDADPVYIPRSETPKQTTVCFWHCREGMECLRYEQVWQTPQTDRIGKTKAFEDLQSNPATFQWWRFAANLGNHTESVIGNGLVCMCLLERTAARVSLRFQRRDDSTVDVELVKVPSKGVTRLVHI